VPPATPADHGPVLLIRHGSDGAGIDNIAVASLAEVTNAVAPCGQQLLHSLGFVLIYLASKGEKAKNHS
jgi:hypothetical protein